MPITRLNRMTQITCQEVYNKWHQFAIRGSHNCYTAPCQQNNIFKYLKLLINILFRKISGVIITICSLLNSFLYITHTYVYVMNIYINIKKRKIFYEIKQKY